MSRTVFTKTYAAPPVSEREILRYARADSENSETRELLLSCINEIREKLTYKVCYQVLPIEVNGEFAEFCALRVRSRELSRNLAGCGEAVIFAATVGVELDRLIAKYLRITPSRALMLQAIGAERIEALCDLFCRDIAAEYGAKLRPRFSPGYGDLPLEVQAEIFAILDPARKIGLSLTDSMIMTPSKSVTAIVGLDGGRGKL